MAKIRLPESGINLIEAIEHILDPEFDQAKTALANLPLDTDVENILAFLVSKLGNSFFAKEEFIYNIISMSEARAQKMMSVEEFMKEVSEAFQEKKSKSIGEKAKSRLASMMEIKSLSALSRARALQNEGEKLLVATRIISDMRSVFNDNCADIIGAVVVHTLKIEHHEDGQHKESFFTLNNADLKSLAVAIERAKNKENKLKEFIASAKVSYYA